MNYKRIFLIFLLTIMSQLVFSQCDSFSSRLLDLIKIEEYNWDEFLMSIEQKRKVMHYPNDSTSDKMLYDLRYELQLEIVKTRNLMVEALAKKGLDIADAKFIECNQAEGSISKLTTKFSIQGEVNSFSIEVAQLGKMYLESAIIFNSK